MDMCLSPSSGEQKHSGAHLYCPALPDWTIRLLYFFRGWSWYTYTFVQFLRYSDDRRECSVGQPDRWR